eukprot:6194807-Pleurochrysis_carterae.AAC.2
MATSSHLDYPVPPLPVGTASRTRESASPYGAREVLRLPLSSSVSVSSPCTASDTTLKKTLA